METVVTWSYSG